MDLLVLVFFCVVALTLQYPGPMSVVFALVLLKITFRWLRSRRYW